MASASRRGFFYEGTTKVESFRQTIGAIYVALAHACGDGVLEEANTYLTDAVNAGAVDDPYARSVIEALVRNTSAGV
jgi:hypothetical protein